MGVAILVLVLISEKFRHDYMRMMRACARQLITFVHKLKNFFEPR